MGADLPGDMHTKNVGGSDGAGLCVFCSMHHAGLWQNDPVFAGIFDYMKSYPGGGYPEKVTRMVDKMCAEKGFPKPRYIQIEGYDRSAMIAASKSGRMVCGTYSRSPTGRYGGSTIAHMVNYVHADESGCWVLDNNYPGADKYEKMTWDEAERFCKPNWLIILLNPAPPYPPRNK